MTYKGPKASQNFVICELIPLGRHQLSRLGLTQLNNCKICDYIGDPEQFQNHMQFIHNVTMILYDRPTLNCSFCHFGFFTDQVCFCQNIS